jgi:Protein of unknown function (DUF1549)/Protein of unknown function (DUF1553)
LVTWHLLEIPASGRRLSVGQDFNLSAELRLCPSPNEDASMFSLRRTLPLLSIIVFASVSTAQTPEIQADIDAQLHALRTAGPAIFGPAASTAAEETAADALAAKIDKQLEAFWAKNKIKPSDPADDAEFLRRVSLDLIGRIPSVPEVRQFLANADPRKREKKIAELLNKTGHFNHFATVIRQQWIPQTIDNPQFQFVGTQFETWLRNNLRKNTGMDQLVREIITAPTLFNRGRPQQGAPQVDINNSAFGFNQVNEFKPENVAASVSRLFMGVKMECAQCHDHPFAVITREQFWETAAFFADLQPTVANATDPKLKREIKIQDVDPKKQTVVQARFFDDSEPQFKDDVSPRTTFADWLLAPQNPYFARITVQRTWAHFFGIGFIDPIDEPGDANPELIPEIVDELAKAFVASKYDNRFLIKAITRTQAYQLSSRQTDPSQAANRHFARMNVKALSAEQLFDSLSQATGFSEQFQDPQRRQFPGNTRREFLTKFASTERSVERQMSILQALTLMNGQFISVQTSVERSNFLSAIAEAPFLDVYGKIDALFMATLSRPATSLEMQRFANHVVNGGTEKDEKKALTDVYWALLNSSEFILNH